MTKVSKNIKKLRKEKNITQDFLAEQLNVTRQAISNWENDKSQPDIDSLKTMSEVFGVEIEELIYGEKRNIGTTENLDRQKNILRIVLAIFGSLFIGIGLVLLFYTYWKDLPLTLKTIFSFLPLLLSQALVLYVFKVKKDNVLWREGAAIFWVVGVVATVALINDILNIHCGYETCLIIDALMCLPVIYLLDAVSPLAVYYYMISHWAIIKLSYSAYSSYYNYEYSNINILAQAKFIYLPLFVVLIAAGAMYCVIKRRGVQDVRFKYTVWISTIELFVFIYIISSFLGISFVISALALSALLYGIADADSDLKMPYKPLGAVGILCCMLFLTENSSLSFYYYDFGYNEPEVNILSYIGMAIAVILVAGAIVYDRLKYNLNLYKILILAFSAADVVLAIVSLFTNFSFGYNLLAIATGVIFILKGISELRLTSINIGLITIFSDICIIISYFNIGTLLLGIIFLLFGIALIVVNKVMVTRKKNVKLEQMMKTEELL